MPITSRKRIAIFLIALVIASFSSGFVVGVFKYPPYDVISSTYRHFFPIQKIENDNSPATNYDETYVNSLIQIRTKEDITNKRNDLIQYIWRGNGFPKEKMPSNVENNIKDERYSDLKNLARIDKITINMEYGVTSSAYLFLADKGNRELVIYQQGHDGDFIKGKNTIKYFLNNGYSVLAFSMPLLGANSQPVVDLSNFGRLKLTSHDYFPFLESPKFSPIKFFVEPIVVSLNYVKKTFGFSSYYMVGISGGGWTTVLYSAIDPTISKSYPVAGSLPMYLRFNNPENIGDYEQMLPTLYNVTNYLDLYIMGSYGDGHGQLQIFNRYDPCCFSGVGYKTYEKVVKTIISRLGEGTFEIFLDEDNKEHTISDKALKTILVNMQSRR